MSRRTHMRRSKASGSDIRKVERICRQRRREVSLSPAPRAIEKFNQDHAEFERASGLNLIE